MKNQFLKDITSIEINSSKIKYALIIILLSFSINSYSQLHPNDAYNLQQTTDIVNGLGKLFEVTPEEKARREAEAQAQAQAYERQRIASAEAMDKLKTESRKDFKINYIDKYLAKAEKGDANLQVFLVYMKAYVYEKQCYCDLNNMLPNWENWLKKAVIDKNVEATTLVGYNAMYSANTLNLGLTLNQGINILEDIAIAEENFPILGIQMDDAVPFQKKTKNTKSVKGVLVKYVDANSAADNAGLKVGDVLLKIDEQPLNSVEQTQNVINGYKPDDSLTITYLKGGKETTTTNAILKKRPISQTKVDVMLILGDYYNRKGAGENAEKALLWYTNAAVNGSPNAMYNLGQIYTTAIAGNSKLNVKHKIKKDPKTAFEWFLKSIENPKYAETYYSSRLKYGSFFKPDSYDELIKMYTKGIGCQKSEENAAHIIKTKEDFLLKEKLKTK